MENADVKNEMNREIKSWKIGKI